MTKGMFIVFEGLDGSGKSTHMTALQKKLRDIGIKCYETREPSDSIIGSIASAVNRGKVELEPETLALVFAADRHEHMSKDIKPLLEKGTTVLCDRYYFSSLAYQKENTSWERIINYNEMAVKNLKADLTIFLDVPPEECIRRIFQNRVTAEKFETLEKLTLTRELYMEAFNRMKEGENIALIDGTGDEQAVFERIWAVTAPLIMRCYEIEVTP